MEIDNKKTVCQASIILFYKSYENSIKIAFFVFPIVPYPSE